MKRFFPVLAAIAVFAASAVPVRAEYRITDQDRADIARVEKYLNSISSLRSKFVQLSSGGRFAEGNIYIQRPRKLRLEYTRPSNIQVYANGFWLAHVDTELEAVWHLPIKTTPASFLIRENIRLSGDISVRRVVRDAKTLSIEVVQTDEPDAGQFVMTFSESPLSLRKWLVTDAQGVSTSVTLVAPAFNVAVPQEVFVFDETRFEHETP